MTLYFYSNDGGSGSPDLSIFEKFATASVASLLA
jgi:hypothetical protein